MRIRYGSVVCKKNGFSANLENVLPGKFWSLIEMANCTHYLITTIFGVLCLFFGILYIIIYALKYSNLARRIVG